MIDNTPLSRGFFLRNNFKSSSEDRDGGITYHKYTLQKVDEDYTGEPEWRIIVHHYIVRGIETFRIVVESNRNHTLYKYTGNLDAIYQLKGILVLCWLQDVAGQLK